MYFHAVRGTIRTRIAAQEMRTVAAIDNQSYALLQLRIMKHRETNYKH